MKTQIQVLLLAIVRASLKTSLTTHILKTPQVAQKNVALKHENEICEGFV